MYKSRNSNRLIGKGEEPSDNIGVTLERVRTELASAPVIEYVTAKFDLPLSTSAIETSFGDEIDLLANPKTMIGATSVDSTFIINGILQTDVLAAGYEILVDGDPTSFTCEDVRGQVLEWGKPTWDAARHLVRAYQLTWEVYQRIRLVNEPLVDVARVGSLREPIQKGEGWPQPYLERVNQRYADIASPAKGPYFGPSTKSLVEMTSDSKYLDSGSVSYIKFPRPVLLEKGLPIGASFAVVDLHAQAQMQRALTDEAKTFKGGTLTISFRIYGLEVWGNTWKDFLRGKTTEHEVCVPGRGGFGDPFAR